MNKGLLLLKAWAGMLFLMIIMGLAIFLPYGGWGYPLARVYLGIFFGSSILITVYLFLFDQQLLQKRLAVGPLAEPTFRQKIIQAAAGLLFLSIYVISAFDVRLLWSGVPLLLSYLGDVFCLLAFVFLFYVFRQNAFLSATIEVQEQQQVVSTGLYAVVRHPMYSGAIVLMLFTPIALGSFCGLIPATCLAIVIGYRAVDEEEVLAANLTGYKEYCQKVKYRLIPGIF